MADLWIVDASPLIVLTKVGQAQLLESLAEQLIVPASVAAEVEAGPPADPARILLKSGFGASEVAREIPAAIRDRGLGKGETEVLALAHRQGAVAVIDDAAARRSANALGIRLIGSLGVIVRARLAGLLPGAGPVLQDLRQAGFRIDDLSIRKALQAVREPWPPDPDL